MKRAPAVAAVVVLAASGSELPAGSAPSPVEPVWGEVAVPAAADAAPAEHWKPRVDSARAYAKKRAGRVAFAVINGGRLRGGLHLDEHHYSASLSKAILMIAYLDRARGRRLDSADRGLLGPMIKASDNDVANRVYGIVGRAGMARVGRRAGMSRLGLVGGWSNTRVTARDQARLFSRVDRLVPERHRGYARALLAKIVPRQRWGIPRAGPRGWRIFFKGGWRRGLVNQAALLERGRQRIAIAILSDGVPDMTYATATLEGVARRLLRGADRLRR